RLLDEAVDGVRVRAARVLLRRDAEEKPAGDAHAGSVLPLLDQLVHREAVLTRHRRDRLAHAAPVHDEQRVDEVVDRQRRLAHELAEQRLLAQPTRAEHAVGHQSLLLPRGPGRVGIRANHSTLARARAALVYSAGKLAAARPRARSAVTRTSRVWAARGRRTRSPRPSSPGRRCTRPSARYSAGTTSTRTPCSRSASAVAGPIAATCRPVRPDHASPSADSR